MAIKAKTTPISCKAYLTRIIEDDPDRWINVCIDADIALCLVEEIAAKCSCSIERATAEVIKRVASYGGAIDRKALKESAAPKPKFDVNKVTDWSDEGIAEAQRPYTITNRMTFDEADIGHELTVMCRRTKLPVDTIIDDIGEWNRPHHLILTLRGHCSCCDRQLIKDVRLLASGHLEKHEWLCSIHRMTAAKDEVEAKKLKETIIAQAPQ